MNKTVDKTFVDTVRKPPVDLSAGISSKARYLLGKLDEKGEAWLVGGAVRDLLRGTPSADEDIATSLLPEETKALFEGLGLTVLDTGLAHGTVSVRLEQQSFEITTFRIDGNYLDGRHPESVCFVRSLKEDLARRDFTVNAMALNKEGKLCDPFDGQADLKAGLIRAVGDPVRRFEEDSLRLLRAVRFARKLGFRIEEATLDALRAAAPGIARVSAERCAAEFLKILEADPDGITDLHEYGLLPWLYPELEACFNCPQETPFHRWDVGRHSVEAAKMTDDLTLRIACLCHDLGKVSAKTYGKDGRAHFYGHEIPSAALTKELTRKLFLPEAERRLITRIVALHNFISERPGRIARLVREESDDVLRYLPLLQRVDVLAQSELWRGKKLSRIERLQTEISRYQAGPHRLKDLAINGKDLQEFGFTGPEIGVALDEALDFVMLQPARNERERLLRRALTLRNRQRRKGRSC